MLNNRNRGFTLFELLAVLAILAIVGAIAVPRVLQTIKTAKEKSLIHSMENISRSLVRYCTEQEMKNGSNITCQLSQVSFNGAEWHKADDGNRDVLLSKALKEYISDDIKSSIDIKLNFQEQDFLTPPNYGCVSTWYPSINSNNKRVYQGNIKPTDYDFPVYTYDEWNQYTNENNYSPIAFLYDVDADGADDTDDFIIYNTYFQVNSGHEHSGQNLNGVNGDGNNNNPLMGTPNSDYIYGYGGNDYIYGLAGNDIIDGGSGTDYAVFNTGSWVDYQISGTEPYTLTGPEGTDKLINIEYLRFNDKSYIKIENFKTESAKLIEGNESNDNLTGNNSSNTLYGKGGNDTLNGEGGNDTLVGGEGDDTLNGGPGQDTAIYHNYWVYYRAQESSEQKIVGLEGTDTLIDIETLKFKTYSYTFNSLKNKQSTFINGTDGDDTYEGTSGEDFFVASSGVDTFNNTQYDTIIINGYRADYTLKYTGGMWVISDGNGNKVKFSNGKSTRVYFYDSYEGVG